VTKIKQLRGEHQDNSGEEDPPLGAEAVVELPMTGDAPAEAGGWGATWVSLK
jgi:hypothetical protein